jgi:hypothetical protein
MRSTAAEDNAIKIYFKRGNAEPNMLIASIDIC